MEPRAPRGELGPAFNMTVLAMKLSAARNAVSKLHREVSSKCGATSSPGEEEPNLLHHQWRSHLELASPRWGPSTAKAAERPGVRRSNDRRPGRSSTRSHRASSGRPTVLQTRDGRVRQPRLRGKAGSGLSDPDAIYRLRPPLRHQAGNPPPHRPGAVAQDREKTLAARFGSSSPARLTLPTSRPRSSSGRCTGHPQKTSPGTS